MDEKLEYLNLPALREIVNSADRDILEAFKRRMDAVEYIGRYKRKNALPIEDAEREKSIIADKIHDDSLYREYEKKLLFELMSLSKSYQRRSLNVYLTGMSADDKKITAEMLERETSRQAVDTDIIIRDRAEADLAQIIENESESGYASREKEALLIVAEHGSLVVSAGAGILSGQDNVRVMRSSGYIVFLDVPLTRLLKMKYEDPRITSSDDITRLYYERIVDYKSTADIILDPEAPDFTARLIEFMRGKELL